MLLKLGHPLLPQTINLRRMHNLANSINRLSVHKKLQLGQVALLPTCILVIQRGIALTMITRQ